jgi:energy-coupling factor transport system permease protein
MAEFELTRNITIGQYVPANSFIHKWDPRYKLFTFCILILAMSFCGSYLANVIAVVFCILLFPISKIPISYGLSGVKPAIPFILALALLQLLFYGGGIGHSGHVYWHWGIITITSASVQMVVVSTMRFIEIIFIASVLTLSTSTTELTHATEALLRPLAKIKVPVHAFALILTIAVRFVPTFAMEMEKLMKAQASRGAEFGTGRWWNILQRTRDMFPLIIPLFNVALARAEDLALAMEARGYVPAASRTAYRKYRGRASDMAALGMGLVISAALLFIPYPF